MEYPFKIWRYIDFLLCIFLGFCAILMSNTVKKLKIEHCSTIWVCYFSWSVEIYMDVVACVPKKYPVTEISPYIIFHNYVLWSVHFRHFYACLFVGWCLKRHFEQYFSYFVAVPFFFTLNTFSCNKEKKEADFLSKMLLFI